MAVIRKIPAIFGAMGLGLTSAYADVPAVAVDIAPLHGLTAQVMGDLGEPALILPQGASPHAYSMRPTEARALHKADLVFWTSGELTPWLARVLERLPADHVTAPMMTREGIATFEFRDNALFEEEPHDDHDGHGEDHEDHHGEHTDHHGDHHEDHAEHHDDGHEAHHDEDHTAHHDEHADHHEDAHDDHDEHHGEEDAHHHDHDHAEGAIDPHGWLSPENAQIWLSAIAEDLTAADPENAQTYRANAAAGQAEIAAAAAEVAAQLAELGDLRYVVFHDAYQYFEAHFGIQPLGAVSLSDASGPGPAHLQALRERLGGAGTVCVFAEPQFNPGLVESIAEGTGAKIAMLDPLGQGIAPGAEFYPALLRALGDAIAGCGA
ncbi:MAG: zinc ABC transporter substrate-binding protein [Mangrovicoccus sp.]|nr:zinc ABC transporter substrate-binding protein [Mangrovicoccus sp.]